MSKTFDFELADTITEEEVQEAKDREYERLSKIVDNDNLSELLFNRDEKLLTMIAGLQKNTYELMSIINEAIDCVERKMFDINNGANDMSYSELSCLLEILTLKSTINFTVNNLENLSKLDLLKLIDAMDLGAKYANAQIYSLNKRIEELEEIPNKAIEFVKAHALNFNGEIETGLEVEECEDLVELLGGESNE